MYRVVATILTIVALGTLPVLAQQHGHGHVVSLPDTLEWVEPPGVAGRAARHRPG